MDAWMQFADKLAFRVVELCLELWNCGRVWNVQVLYVLYVVFRWVDIIGDDIQLRWSHCLIS